MRKDYLKKSKHLVSNSSLKGINVKKSTQNSDMGTGYSITSSVKEQFQVRLHHTKYHSETFKILCEKAYCILNNLGISVLLHSDNNISPCIKSKLKHFLDQENSKFPSSVLLISKYHNQLDVDSCRPHCDAGILTICINPEMGLQLFDKIKNEWIEFGKEVESEKLCNSHSNITDSCSKKIRCVIFFGDSMSTLTDGQWPSVIHKVKNTKITRYSIVFKLRVAPGILSPRTDVDFKILMQQSQDGTPFPKEILSQILLFLTPENICKCGMVCKFWRMTSNSDFVWHSLCMKRWGTIAVNANTWKEVYLQKHMTKSLQIRSTYNYVIPKSKSSGIYSVKTVFIGSEGVGKTCCMWTYVADQFPLDYVPTVFDENSVNIFLDGNTIVNLILWDTSGSPEYARLRPLSYPDTDVVILMFSVANRKSLNEISRVFIPEFKKTIPEDVPFILVASKIDLRAEPLVDIISREEGKEFAKKIGAKSYFEISSLHLDGLKELMEEACRIGLAKKYPILVKKSKVNCVIE